MKTSLERVGSECCFGGSVIFLAPLTGRITTLSLEHSTPLVDFVIHTLLWSDVWCLNFDWQMTMYACLHV